jgi:hypothetical protein
VFAHTSKREEAAGEAASSWLRTDLGGAVPARRGAVLVRPCREGGCFSPTLSDDSWPEFRPWSVFFVSMDGPPTGPGADPPSSIATRGRTSGRALFAAGLSPVR